jgi:hypothetical protein
MLHGPASTGKFTFERLARIIASKALRLLEEMFDVICPTARLTDVPR